MVDVPALAIATVEYAKHQLIVHDGSLEGQNVFLLLECLGSQNVHIELQWTIMTQSVCLCYFLGVMCYKDKWTRFENLSIIKNIH